jgi:hypothetical protein
MVDLGLKDTFNQLKHLSASSQVVTAKVNTPIGTCFRA